MKICILTPRFPFPENGGDVLRINNIARYLKSKNHKLILISFSENKCKPVDDYYKIYDKIYIIKRTKIISLLALIAIVLSITLSSAGIISVLASFTFAANVQPFTSKKYTYSWTEVAENDHTEEVYFDCYPINSGYSGSHPGIAIAWHNEEEGPKNDTPDYLEVPKTLYDTNNTPYDVVAIYKAGFRYCDFSSVSLPSSFFAASSALNLSSSSCFSVLSSSGLFRLIT